MDVDSGMAQTYMLVPPLTVWFKVQVLNTLSLFLFCR